MMFRHSTCVVCGKVPPSLGFEERPSEQQGRPAPPSSAELEKLWGLRGQPEAQCPRCRRRIGLHLARIEAARERLGSANDTSVARELKVPVVMVRNVRQVLGIASAPQRPSMLVQRLSEEQLAAYRDGTLTHAQAAEIAGTNTSSVRAWRARHIDDIVCPQPPDPVPREFLDRALPDDVVADLCGCSPVTVWKWRRQHPTELRSLRPEVRERLRARHREYVELAMASGQRVHSRKRGTSSDVR